MDIITAYVGQRAKGKRQRSGVQVKVPGLKFYVPGLRSQVPGPRFSVTSNVNLELRTLTSNFDLNL
jgi:hypothetical protein